MVRAIIEDGIGPLSNAKVLDVGCGNGGIANAFADQAGIWGVDIEDKRRDGFPTNFSVVDSELLPFEGDTFDLVVSHHVIEHVEDQELHLSELHRVLRPDGLAYLATPNRSSPIMSGHVGNDKVLHWPEMAPLFERAGFSVQDYGWRVFSAPTRVHFSPAVGRLVPGPLAKMLRRWFPSHMFLLRPTET